MNFSPPLVSLVTVLTSLLTLTSSMKVLTTVRGQTLHAPASAEMTNSSVKTYDEFTLCGRFVTFQFWTRPGHSFQSIISLKGSHLLGKLMLILICYLMAKILDLSF